MKIIDRYLLKQFIRTYLICYISMTGLYIIFNAFTNLEEFLRVSDQAGGVLGLMISFYSYESLKFFDSTAGLLSLVAATFTMAWLQRNNEMTALMAAGISRFRIAMPVIGAVIVISLLAAANREFLIPSCIDQLTRRPQDLIGDVAQAMAPRYDDKTNVLIRGKTTYRDKERITFPDFMLPAGLSRYGTQLKAKDAFYKAPEKDRPGGYLLKGVTQPEELATRDSLLLGKEPVVIMPRDADWLQPDECFVTSGVSFEQLTGGDTFRQFASTGQLINALATPSLGFGADVRVAIHSRIATPFLDVTLLFVGLPLIVSRGNRNVFVAIGMCVSVVVLFMLVVMGFQHLGNICSIDAALAAWAPLIIFVPAAVWSSDGLFR